MRLGSISAPKRYLLLFRRIATSIRSVHSRTFTRDLIALADWLHQCNIRSVAMESTGVYWIPLYQILETHGFRSLSGQRTAREERSRAEERRFRLSVDPVLHSVGIAKGEFSATRRDLRTPLALASPREPRSDGSRAYQHMQKALSQMNLQLHHVLSEITGVSGTAILDAILAGERDPAKLANLCNRRISSPRQTVAKSLEGDYRPEHLFALRQSLAAYRFYQHLMAEVDLELAQRMQELPRAEHAPDKRPPRTKKRIYQRAGNEPSFDLKAELFRIAGVDLTDVPGISTLTAHTILMEVGPDVSRFRNASAFASWLGLCPEKQVSGGKVLYTRTRKVKNRAAIALRLGAHCLYHAQNYLGEFHRRMKWRLGAPAAVTATAHKLARIVYHMLSTRQPYSDEVFARADQQISVRAEMRLRKQAADLGFQLAPITGTA